MRINKQNSFPKAVLDRKIEVDAHQMNVREFLKGNFYNAGAKQITPSQVRSVIDLEPGESINLMNVEVKRIT
ncbi:MAG: hypothetical protein JWR50_610 [Mucilaginibacter sp.]|nr:hypothetical protein [Mucilaginibacter sp.]